MSLNKWTDEEYYQQWDGGDRPDDFDGLGAYQYITLPEIVDNFLLTYTGAGKVINSASKHEVLFHAQRAVAELSYDVARPIKSFEYELIGSLTIPLPKDYVSLNGVFVLGDKGVKHQLRERKESGNPSSPLQDNEGRYLYTQDGTILETSNNSTANERYVENTEKDDFSELGEYYGLGAAYFTNEYGGFGYQGRRYGLSPEHANINGTYVLDDVRGLLLFDNKVSEEIIVIDYITDGLDEDISNIKIHKFLEESVYAYITMKIAKGMSNVTGQDKIMFERDYNTNKRRSKHRLSKVNANELIYTFRNKAKWLKF